MAKVLKQHLQQKMVIIHIYKKKGAFVKTQTHHTHAHKHTTHVRTHTHKHTQTVKSFFAFLMILQCYRNRFKNFIHTRNRIQIKFCSHR